MDYRAHLLLPLSKRYIDQLALEVFIHPETFARIYELIFDTDTTVAWRAAWACQKISEKQPELFTDKQFNELAAFTIASSHDGIKRGCLGTLNNLPLPQPIPVELINACFDWLISTKSAIAVQALSLKLLYKFCLNEPGLIPELEAYLENFDNEGLSPGLVSTKRNITKLLKNNKKKL